MSEYVTFWEGGEPLFAGEEIVRCRDCEHYDTNDEASEVYPDRYWCDVLSNYLPADFYCACGERRDA